MTPGEYKSGGAHLEIRWATFETPLGRAGLAQTERGICSLSFVENDSKILTEIRKHWPNAKLVRDPKGIQSAADEIRSRMMGRAHSEIKLLLGGTPFQVKVWEALLRIPEGQVTSYQRLAKRIGSPKASRAVGSAVGANPIAYLIPCHRVIRSTGIIGDYHWGSARKTALLAIEFDESRRPR